MRNYQNVWGTFAIALSLVGLGLACGEDASSSGAGQAALRGGVPASGAAGEGDGDEVSDEGDDATDESGDDGEGFVPGDSSDLPEGFCEHGGMVGRIEVTFDCGEVEIISCKDLSNVVLEFADGTRQKFDGLSGQSASFSGTGDNAGKEVVGVWVKAGSNHSGDGPGYGERFDAPGEQSCDPPSGDGDGDDDLCGDQPDEDCPPPGDNGDGDGDSGDGDGDSGDGDGDSGDGDGDSGDGDGDDDVCGDQPDEDCGGEPPPPPDDDGSACLSDPSIPCDPI